jgi:MFS family permease
VYLSREGRLLFAAKAVRTFAFGWLSVVLALFLARLGFSPAEIGAVLTATMVEDALLTIALSSLAARVGPWRIMALTAPLITVGGVLLATAEARWVLVAGAVLGTLSPNGQETGPFSALEQALLPESAPSGARTRLFGWYNVAGFLPAALGAVAAGTTLESAPGGAAGLAGYRLMAWGYAGAGVLLTALYVRLGALTKQRAQAGSTPAAGRLGLHRSRGAVLELAGLQSLDALAGGFIMQSLLAYWFHLRFGVGPETLGALFFGTNLLSALSFVLAARIADRFGLLNTMVFTHLPSNVLLLLVPFMPSFPAAAAVLLARHLLSQMDVPTRQAFTMALVAAEERPAAAGLTSSARSLAQACAPVVSGATMAVAATSVPFLLAGGLKIVYDLALFVRFRKVSLDEE